MIELNSSAYPASASAGSLVPSERVHPSRVRFQLVSAQPVAAGNELYLRRPLSLTFVGFVIALVGLGVATFLQPGAISDIAAPDTSLINRLGVIGSTIFALAASAIVYRAVTTRSPAMVPIALLLIGPGAWWNWGLFSNAQPSMAALSRPVTLLVAIGAAAVAACLVLEATRNARWLGVYCGLGTLGLAAAAVLVRIDTASSETASLPMMMILSGLACLYGTLVEIEAVRRQSLEELLRAKAKTETEITQAEDVLHDLRSGLLSIETAIGSFDSEMVGPLRNEAARLRGLTVRSKAQIRNVDLVPGLRNLAHARRPTGLMVDVRLPASMVVRGDEGELLSVVDNLLSNAHRHGCAPIRLEAGEHDGWTWVAVTDSGPRTAELESGRVFLRGHSSHPDGQGIGLNRAQLLAEKNYGQLTFDTLYNGGTRFVLSLPAPVQTHALPPSHPPQSSSAPHPVASPPLATTAPPADPVRAAVAAAMPPAPTSAPPDDQEVTSVPEPRPEPEPAPAQLPAQTEGHIQMHEPAPLLEPVNQSEPDRPETPATREPNFDFLADLIPDLNGYPPTQPKMAREPWTWPDDKAGRSTPPLPPPSMALEAPREATPSQPVASADEINSDVIDLAGKTNEVVLDLEPLSEWPTGPVPIVGGTEDVAGAQPASAEAL